MLGARVIGFQDYAYVRHCISSCARVLGVEHNPTGIFLGNTPVYLSVLPLGIDPVRTRAVLEGPAVRERLGNLKQAYGGKRVIVGIDKTEQVRGIKHKLESFRMLLQRHPEWIGNVL